MIKGVLTKSHGVVIMTMAGLFGQTNWILSQQLLDNGEISLTSFQKDAIEYQIAHFINFSISGFFFPLTTSALLTSLIALRQYNNYTNYEEEKQKYYKQGQSTIIAITSLLGLSVPCRYILLNKHR